MSRATTGVNVALRLSNMAQQLPQHPAVVMPLGRSANEKRQYRTVNFAELEADTNRIASGLVSAGATPGMRLVLMVRPSIDFIALVFALFKTGVTTVLIDPGMGRARMIACLQEITPHGFVAIPLAHAIRTLLWRKFPFAQFNVTVGRRWFWRGMTLDEVRKRGNVNACCAPTQAEDAAAIIFTTGSTGPPKGVQYSHGNFDQQVVRIRDQYNIVPGEIDLAGFPLFGLFNAAMGVTTVIPDMDPTRPARVDPRNIVEAANDWNITQSFASPAVWNVVGRHCAEQSIRMPTLRRVLSAGAPVPPHVLQSMMQSISPDGEMHTPYGATEALPVATISAHEVLGETASRTRAGQGTCVGRRFGGIDWRVIRISDEPLATIDKTTELPRGEIGELIVRGPVVTRSYVASNVANALHKVSDGDTFWHRMGDVGYLDEHDRFWYCGRKSHRVVTTTETLFTEPCEAIFNEHPWVSRSALVGIGPRAEQTPILLVELASRAKSGNSQRPPPRKQLEEELRALATQHSHTQSIRQFLLHPQFPVDIRHNAKIFREKLAIWAERKVRIAPENA